MSTLCCPTPPIPIPLQRAPWRRWWADLRASWQAAQRQRQLAGLIDELSDETLRDIGLGRCAAQRQARREMQRLYELERQRW